MAGIWCLDENEGLSPGQSAEIDRVIASHPELSDDAFVQAISQLPGGPARRLRHPIPRWRPT